MIHSSRLQENLTLQATVRLRLVQPAVRPLLHVALAALRRKLEEQS